MTRKDMEETILQILEEINDEIDYRQEDALVDDGLIDSLDLTQIIAGVDEAFHIALSARDIEPENFNSVSAMASLIQRTLEGGK